MSRLRNTLAFLLYGAAAVAVGVYLPLLLPAVSAGEAILCGGMLFLAGALLHEVTVRRRREIPVRRRIAWLRRANQQLTEELARARDEARRIYEALEQAGPIANAEERERMTDVVAEVKVLQNLIERLYAAREVEAASGGLFAEAVPDGDAEAGVEGAAVLDFVREALRQDRIDVFLQPVVSLPQRKRRFYECFTRIRGADGSFVLPEQYITVAEEAGLIAAIDNMLLFRGVQLVRRSQRRHFDLGFFCNISPHTMRDREFFGDFVEFMEENAELAPNLVFEFAQSAVAQQDAETRADLQRLAALGFRFSMDGVTDLDFEPEELAGRHFRFVKVDCARLLAKARAESPVLDLREHGQVRARKPAHDLRSLKAALDKVGIDLIVEKIESDTDLVELLEYNIDFGQGYLFGEPRAAPALDEASD